jgi:REP element-mobilizing transposase RayT
VPRRPRRELPDTGIFHITARGVNRSLIAFDDVDFKALQELVLKAAERWGWEYDVYCLMSTHFHLVIPAPVPAISAAMHWLMGIYAQRINRRHNRTGHLFENRFSAWVIRDEDHWRKTCRYVLENPVKAGLCASALDWPWSGGRYLREYRP